MENMTEGAQVSGTISAEYRNHLLMNNLRVSVSKHIMDDDLTLLWADPCFYEQTGYSQEEYGRLFHNHVREHFQSDPVEYQRVQSLISESVSQEHPGFECVSYFPLRDGSRRPVRLTGVVTEEAAGQYPTVYVIFTSIEDLILTRREQSVAYDSIPGFVAKFRVTQEHLSFVEANDRFLRFFSSHSGDFPAAATPGLEKNSEVLAEAFPLMRAGSPVHFEISELGPDGNPMWFQVNGGCVDRIDGDPVYLFVYLDVTGQHRMMEDLRESEQRFEAILSQTQDIIFEYDFVTKQCYFSPDFQEKFGPPPSAFSPSAIIGDLRLHPDDKALLLGQYRDFLKGSSRNITEYRLRKENGEYLWCRVTAASVRDRAGNIQKIIGIISDIDAQKQELLAIRENAMRDPLTNIYNRKAIENLISDYINGQPGPAALFVIDIDNFKSINDSFGHIYGDAVLSGLAYSLLILFENSGYVGRIGGDEFAVFLTDARDRREITELAVRAGQLLERAFVQDNMSCLISGSVGIAFYPEHGASFNRLLDNADAAMYYAKNHGKNQFAVYSEQIGEARMMLPQRSTDIDSDRNSLKTFRENILEYVFRIFYENKDIPKAISLLLDLVGNHFDCSRGFIYEAEAGNKRLVNTFEWCQNKVASMREAFPSIPLEKVALCSAAFGRNGVLHCPDVSGIKDREIREWFLARGTKALLLCRICEDHTPVLLMGFEDCAKIRQPVPANLSMTAMISQIISLFLIKERQREQLCREQEFSGRLLEHISARIYGVNPRDYSLVFINRQMAEDSRASLGELCYQVLRGASQPCPDCPLKELRQGRSSVTRQVYRDDLHTWYESTASLIRWKDKEEIALFSSMDITKYRADSVRIDFLNRMLPGGVFSFFLEEGFPLNSVNVHMLEFLGYENEEEFLSCTGGSLLSFVFPEDRRPLEDDIRLQLSGGEEYEATFRILKKDGSFLWVRSRGRKNLTESGKVSLLSLCMDITSQKELENQLELYRSSSTGGAFIMCLDDDFTLLYANDIFYKVHEYTREGMEMLLGNRYARCIYHDDLPRVRESVALPSAKNSLVSWEMRVITGKGHLRWLLVNASFEYRDGRMTVNGFVSDHTARHRLMEQLERSEQRYRIALKQTNTNVWEYDIKRRRLIPTESAKDRHGYHGAVENVPDSLMESGFIHPDSIGDFREMYLRVLRGEKLVTADIRTRTPEGSGWWWEKNTYTVIFDRDGRPERAVGVGEDITKQKEASLRYRKELQMRRVLDTGVLASSRVNLTKNTVEYMQNGGREHDLQNHPLTYEEMFRIGAQNMINQDDLQRYQQLMSREALINAYERHVTQVTTDYRRKDKDGNLKWASGTIHLVKDSSNGDLYAYGIIRNIDEPKTIELSLERHADKDILTDVYKRDTAIRMMDEYLKNCAKNGRQAVLLVFNIDHYQQQAIFSEYDVTDQMLKELSTQLLFKFGGSNIIGRIHADEFAILLDDRSDLDSILQTADDIRQTFRMPYLFPMAKLPASVSVGAACSRQADTFKKLYSCAQTALNLVKTKGGNGCLLYRESMGGTSGEPEEEIRRSIPAQPPAALPEESSLSLNCAHILAFSAFEEAAPRVLKDIGSYYEADRVLLVDLEEDSSLVRQVYEWREDGLPPISREEIAALDQERVATFKMMAVHDSLTQSSIDIFLQTFPATYDFMVRKGIRLFSCVMITREQQSLGYLLVANPSRSRGISALLSIRPFLANELFRLRLQERHSYYLCHDPLTGLLNRYSFSQYQHDLAEESLISMGVALMDINGLKRMNSDYGNSYGDELIKFIASAMQEAFPDKLLFRFSGDEFLAICENLTRDSFTRCLESCLETLNTRYPGTVSSGYAWGDTDIRLESLLSHADERMIIAKQKFYKKKEDRTRRYDPSVLQNLLQSIRNRSFQIYLQPKARLPERIIDGAEALIRLVTPRTGVMAPSHFIPPLEKAGLIKYVDLFVFEEVCRTLERWKSQGCAPVSVSLNFSRSTLLEENLLEEMREISEKYDFDRDYIRIEITESLGDLERRTMAQLSEELIGEGYKLSLDDFGAQYSNISILSAVRFHELKLDKSLVNDLSSNPNTRILVKNFLSTCRDMNIISVAEGVETREQLELLTEMKCDYAQGYYFNKPLPAEDFERIYLKKR